ncbi:hypothetical protein COCMIDRAFT_63109, partial [Bipolaris oryzae ATCC 44560]
VLVTILVSAASVSANCIANILNINQAIVGSGCIPAGGTAFVAANGANWLISASRSCGLGLS